jgi:hypothetical protein
MTVTGSNVFMCETELGYNHIVPTRDSLILSRDFVVSKFSLSAVRITHRLQSCATDLFLTFVKSFMKFRIIKQTFCLMINFKCSLMFSISAFI